MQYTFCFPRQNNARVQSKLALTPSQIKQRVDQGLPVGDNFAEGTFDDGEINCPSDVPLLYRRGVDINALWETQTESRKYLKSNSINYGRQFSTVQ